MSAEALLTAAAIVSTGLMAGLFYGWSVSVIPGTRRVGDTTYIETMQRINRAIVNPAFVIPFMGTPLILLAAAYAQRQAGNDRAALWLAVAAGVYVVGMLGVTFRGNIPLNNALDAFDLADADERSAHERRRTYEQGWNRWHSVRTVAVTVSLASATVAVVAESD